jgi:small subunit ribosomal protein SAe
MCPAGVLYYLLARMVLQMRGTVTASNPWDAIVSSGAGEQPMQQWARRGGTVGATRQAQERQQQQRRGPTAAAAGQQQQ